MPSRRTSSQNLATVGSTLTPWMGRRREGSGVSVGARKLQGVLSDEVHDLLFADRGDPQQPALAEQSLHLVLGGITHPTVGLHRAIGGEEAGTAGQEFGGVGLGGARGAAVVETRGESHHRR